MADERGEDWRRAIVLPFLISASIGGFQVVLGAVKSLVRDCLFIMQINSENIKRYRNKVTKR